MKKKSRIKLYIIAAVLAVFGLVLAVSAIMLRSALGRADIHSGYQVEDEIPEWNGKDPSVEVNGGKPEFEKKEIKRKGFDRFEELDKYGRCGTATACVGPETMPDGERGSIGMVRPSGWQLKKYGFIDNGGYLYNRCHLVGWQLTGQNEEERNLITGTRYMNVEGMLPYEDTVAWYVRDTGNHVMYRSTPVFHGKELVARGVQLEAYSVEDKGKGVSFNVYCYNVQPGVLIDYSSGKSKADGTIPADGTDRYTDEEENEEDVEVEDEEQTAEAETDPEIPDGVTYILNMNTMRFHRTDCSGARDIAEHNREWFYGTRDEAIEEGFVPCGMCNP